MNLFIFSVELRRERFHAVSIVVSSMQNDS